MDISWVQNLKTLFNGLITEMKVVVFYLKCLFQITQSRSKFLCSSENASKVVICDSSILISFISECLCLPEQLKSHIKVFYSQWSNWIIDNLPFCKKLMLRMLQIMAASWLDFITASLLSPYNSFCIMISSSNFLRASRYFLWEIKQNEKIWWYLLRLWEHVLFVQALQFDRLSHSFRINNYLLFKF